MTVRLTGSHQRIKTLEFDVFAPSFTLIEQNDVADIKCIDGFTSNELTILQNDDGDINLYNLNLQNLYIELNDVGNIELSGMTEDITASLEGVGEIHLFEMNCKTAEVILSGIGDIEINASESLEIDLLGVGSVYFRGSPNIVINKTGVGQIVNVN